jgi:hypothetical protein
VRLTTWHPLSAKKLALTSLTSGGRSVGIVRLRTETMEYLAGSFNLFVSYDNHGLSNSMEQLVWGRAESIRPKVSLFNRLRLPNSASSSCFLQMW